MISFWPVLYESETRSLTLQSHEHLHYSRVSASTATIHTSIQECCSLLCIGEFEFVPQDLVFLSAPPYYTGTSIQQLHRYSKHAHELVSRVCTREPPIDCSGLEHGLVLRGTAIRLAGKPRNLLSRRRLAFFTLEFN